MYTKLMGASTSERARVLFCVGMWSLHEMYAFTRDGRVRIVGLSTLYVLFFFSICMGIGRDTVEV